MKTVPKELYDELLEKYINLVKENEWRKSLPNTFPRIIDETVGRRPPQVWY